MKPLRDLSRKLCRWFPGAASGLGLKFSDDAEYVLMQYGDIEAPVNLIGMFGGLFTEREV